MGSIENESDYYPFGGERVVSQSVTNQNYKFTGKERDAESELDYFGARYFSSTMGRWLTPDWSGVPAPVPYADLGNPQTLNLYGYVDNNPMSHADADGHATTLPFIARNGNIVGFGWCEGGSVLPGMCHPGPVNDTGQPQPTQVQQDQKAAQQKETVVFSDSASRTSQPGGTGAAADRTVDYQAAKMDKSRKIDSHDIERQATLTLHEKLDPNSKTKSVNIADKANSGKGVYKDYQFVQAGGSFRVLRDWKVNGDSARVLDVQTHKAYRYELTTLDSNSKTPIKTEYTNAPPF